MTIATSTNGHTSARTVARIAAPRTIDRLYRSTELLGLALAVPSGSAPP